MKVIHFFCLTLFGIFLMIAFHESLHLMQHKGQVDEICLAGYSPGAAGWVVPTNQSELDDYYIPDKFSFSNLSKQTLQKEEFLPTILSMIVFCAYMASVSYQYSKEQREEMERWMKNDN